jgi:hypothetical protein
MRPTFTHFDLLSKKRISSNQKHWMAKERDLGLVLNHLEGMYFQNNGQQRSDLAAINQLTKSHLHVQISDTSFTPNSPRTPSVFVSSSSTAAVLSETERKAASARHKSPLAFLEPSSTHISAITLELDSSICSTTNQSTQKGNRMSKSNSKPSDSNGSPRRNISHSQTYSKLPSNTAGQNWGTASWTIQSRARDEILDGMFSKKSPAHSKPHRRVSPAARKSTAEEKKVSTSPTVRLQKPDFLSPMVMIQAITAERNGAIDSRTLAAQSVQSLAVLMRHSACSLGTSFCITLFEGIFRSIYQVDDRTSITLLELTNWIQNMSVEADAILSLTDSLQNLSACSEAVEIAADTVHDQSRIISDLQKQIEARNVEIRKLSLELTSSKQTQSDAELNLLSAISQSNSSMVGGEMSNGFVSNLIFQDALRSSEQLRDDLKDARALLLIQQASIEEKEQGILSYKMAIQEQELGLKAMNQQLNDSQMTITSRDLQIEKLTHQYNDEYNRNPINPSNSVDLIMNSSTWVSKLVRSEDVFDFKYRQTETQTQNTFSQRDQCLGLLLSWINKHLESAKVDMHVSNFGRDLSSGIVFVELFRRCMGNNSYYQQKCDVASVEIDTDSRLKHVAEMASTLLSSPISVSDIISAEPKTIWMIVSELFNTNPTLDPCSIANLKVLSSDAIHVIRRQSLGMILSDSFQSTSNSAMFMSIKASTRDALAIRRTISEMPHDSLYAHMNPNVVVFTLNELSPRWALHRLPIRSLLESLSKSGGNGCLALCATILHRHRSQLSDVFRYYSLLGRDSATSLPSMDIGELGIFLADSQIDLEPDIAEKLLQMSCQECNLERIEAGDEALDLTSFLVFLIRLAIEPGIKVAKDGDTEYMVATVLTQIVQNHVCSRAIRLVMLNPSNTIW